MARLRAAPLYAAGACARKTRVHACAHSGKLAYSLAALTITSCRWRQPSPERHAAA